MKKSIYWLGIVLAVAVVIAVVLIGPGKKRPEGGVLATVGDETITIEDFKEQWRKNLSLTGGSPSETVDKFLNDMIIEKLFLSEARRRKIDRDSRFREEMENYREQLLVEGLLNREVLAVGAPTAVDVEDYWKEHHADFFVPELIRVSHVLVKEKEGEGTEELQARIQAVFSRLEAGENFAELASRVSEDGSAFRGGDLGYFSRGQLVPELEEEAWELKIDEVSDPIKTQYGRHIIMVTDKKPSREKTLEEARVEVVATLQAKKRKARFDALESELKAKTAIQVDQLNLDQLRETLGQKP